MKRILTAALLIPLFIACALSANPYPFYTLVAVVALFCVAEYLSIAQGADSPPLHLLAYTLVLALLACALWPKVITMPQVLAVVFAGIMAHALLHPDDTGKFLSSAAATLFGPLFIGVMLGHIAALKAVGETTGTKLVFLLALGVWVGDTSAYYVGKTLGRHKLYERISPKKTWEGAAGNVVGSTAAVWCAKLTFFPELGNGHVLALGILLATFGIFGDLFESTLKRGAGVKDSSSLLPGHGGMMDRLDSIMFTGPVLFYYYQAFLR